MKTIQMVSQVTVLSAALTLALSAHAALPAAGNVTSTIKVLPNRETAAVNQFETRILARYGSVTVPRRSYTTSCVNSSGTQKIFTSLTTQAAGGGGFAGMILSATVDATTNAVTATSIQSRTFGNCTTMGGIVADQTCSTVAALCKSPSSVADTTADFDLVKSLTVTSANSMYDLLTGAPTDSRMWLYEWRNSSSPTSATSTYRTFIVGKALNNYENAHFDLAMSPPVPASGNVAAIPGYYGVSMKASAGADEGDSFVVFNRTATIPSIDTSRGWKWECAPGHTRSNRVAYNVTAKKFGVFCTTDLNHIDFTKSTAAGAWMHTEGDTAVLVRSLYRDTTTVDNKYKVNGGAGRLLATATGFIGVFVGSDYNAGAPTANASKIYVVNFNSNGTIASGPTQVASITGYFTSYPQLVSLGTDRYLLGWSQMMAKSATSSLIAPTPSGTQHAATNYYVKEINGAGTALTQQSEPLPNGWGEQDAMVSLGSGRAGWVYRPDPTIKFDPNGTTVNLPSPNSTELAWSVYKR